MRQENTRLFYSGASASSAAQIALGRPVIPVVDVVISGLCRDLFAISPFPAEGMNSKKARYSKGFKWSEREDLNLRPLVSQTSALTGLRHAPMPFH